MPDFSSEGRIKVGEALLFPNLFSLGTYHPVICLCDAYFLKLSEFTPEMIANGFWATQQFNLLLNVSVDEISECYSPVLGEAVKRIRKDKFVSRRAGFDGEFGVIKVFDEEELKELVGQSSLFSRKKKSGQSR